MLELVDGMTGDTGVLGETVVEMSSVTVTVSVTYPYWATTRPGARPSNGKAESFMTPSECESMLNATQEW